MICLHVVICESTGGSEKESLQMHIFTFTLHCTLHLQVNECVNINSDPLIKTEVCQIYVLFEIKSP